MVSRAFYDHSRCDRIQLIEQDLMGPEDSQSHHIISNQKCLVSGQQKHVNPINVST